MSAGRAGDFDTEGCELAAAGAVDLPWTSVALSLGFIVINIVISSAIGLGLEGKFFIASFRTTIQLALLGYILLPVFKYSSWYASLLIALCMSYIAAREAYYRCKYHFRGLFLYIFMAVALPGLVVLGVTLTLIIPIHPWYSPQYSVPLLGMLINNCLNTVSVGFNLFTTELGERPFVIEEWVARGASWWEAVLPLVIKSTQAGLMPTLNNMYIIGIVSIPGMMTGQMLSGNSPEQAARYQMIIMFIVCSTSTIGLLTAIWLCCVSMFDDQARLLSSWKLTRRQKDKEVGVTKAFQAIKSGLVRAWKSAAARLGAQSSGSGGSSYARVVELTETEFIGGRN